MGKVEWGNEAKRQEYGLAYANDMILLAEDYWWKGDMRSMIEKLEGYIERKGLEL